MLVSGYTNIPIKLFFSEAQLVQPLFVHLKYY